MRTTRRLRVDTSRADLLFTTRRPLLDYIEEVTSEYDQSRGLLSCEIHVAVTGGIFCVTDGAGEQEHLRFALGMNERLVT